MYLNMTESAEYLGVARKTLYNMIESKRIPQPDVIAGHSVYAKDTLDAYRPVTD